MAKILLFLLILATTACTLRTKETEIDIRRPHDAPTQENEPKKEQPELQSRNENEPEEQPPR